MSIFPYPKRFSMPVPQSLLQSHVESARYAKCVEVSGRIRWDIDRDVIRGRSFDFGRRFLPDGLSKVDRLDFLVYADLFLTPTAAMADVVLPVSSAWEREGLRVGFGPTQAGESFAQLRGPVIAPLGEARSDTWIVCELARRLGLGKTFFDGSEDAGHRFALEPSGVTLEQLRAHPGGVRVPVETRFKRYTAPGPDGITKNGILTRRKRFDAIFFKWQTCDSSRALCSPVGDVCGGADC